MAKVMIDGVSISAVEEEVDVQMATKHYESK
jgi:hypothetical protein